MPCDNHGGKCNGKECFNKNLDNGLMTRIWGPSGWLFLHCITFGYPYKINSKEPEHIDKQNDYYKFFYYLGKVLPCKYCRDSYMEFFTKNSPTNHLGSRQELTKWLYNIHNLVNDKLGVNSCERPTFNEIEETYQSFRANCKPLTTKEKEDKKGKGCLAPADGKPKRSILKVIEYDSVPKQQLNTVLTQDFPKSNDYFIINKKIAYISLTVLLTVLLIFIISMSRNKHKLKT